MAPRSLMTRVRHHAAHHCMPPASRGSSSRFLCIMPTAEIPPPPPIDPSPPPPPLPASQVPRPTQECLGKTQLSDRGVSTMIRRTVRREEQVTVQGPIWKPMADSLHEISLKVIRVPFTLLRFHKVLA